MPDPNLCTACEKPKSGDWELSGGEKVPICDGHWPKRHGRRLDPNEMRAAEAEASKARKSKPRTGTKGKSFGRGGDYQKRIQS